MTTIMKVLGQHLALLRRRAGLSQDEAATQMKMHPRGLKGLEGGKGNPKLDTLEKFALAYKVTMCALFEPFDQGPQRAPVNVLQGRLEEILKDQTHGEAVRVLIDSTYRQLKRRK